MKIDLEPFEPRTRQIHWCYQCDQNQVDSAVPETGRFFTLAGHIFNPVSREYDGDYCNVLFSVCSQCLDLSGK